MAAERDGVLQRGYELEIAAAPDFTGARSTGAVERASPVGVAWPWAPLASRERVWCRVRAATDRGWTGWSDPLAIEGSLYAASDWIARPVSPVANVARAEPGPAALLRRAFTLDRPVMRARLYATALGVQHLWLNGRAVSDALLDPGWTDYRHRLLFAAHDVTGLLNEGHNVVAAAVADGWWRGKLTWLERRAVYGDTTALIAQLEIEHDDGSRTVIATDGAWRGGAGGWRAADLYDGCDLDLTAEPAGWRLPGFDDRGWSAVTVLPSPARLEQRSFPPVRILDTVDVAATPNARGTLSLDCGQNLTGHLRLTLAASEEAEVEVRHAEVLEPDGRLHTAALRTARAADRYRVPPGRHVVEPDFTYHGFRHAEIACPPGVCVERAEARVVASDLAETGRFRCSDARVNRLFENIRWSQRGNFLAIPTDCPQRDERLGWTGDIQVFARTACTNADARSFLASWLVDLASEQAADGRVTSTVPNVIGGHPYEYAGVGWSDAATLVPWALWEAYGDRGVLARQYPSMAAWVDWGASRLDASGVWTGDFHLGDWLDPGAPPDRPEEATTDRDYLASAYLARSADVLAKTADVLGDAEASARYAALAARVAAATWARWREAAVATQAGCAVAIEFGIAPPDARAAVGAALASLVVASDGRIATGFLGTPLLLPALFHTGQRAAAYRLLMNEQPPGWLYQVQNGATTMWERWDAILPGGRIHGGGMAAEDAASMTSFNHYAYGAVGEALYRQIAGIAPAAPAYAAIDFAPDPGGGLDWAEADIETPLGHAAIRWEVVRDALAVTLTIPPGATARFLTPEGWRLDGADAAQHLGSGTHHLRLTAG